MGAWIEITIYVDNNKTYYVAPLVGAWIEITRKNVYGYVNNVAPLVGAWIEIGFLIILRL